MNRSEQPRPLTGVLLYAVLNVPVSLAIVLPLFQRARSDLNGLTVTGVLMFLSALACLNLAYGLVLAVLAVVRTPRLPLAILAVILASLLQIYLITDVKVFSFFKFHINGLILNFLTTEGAGDSLELGTATLVSYAAACLLVIAGEIFLVQRLFYRQALAGLRRHTGALVVGLLMVVAADKALYAHGDLTNQVAVLVTARYYPFYGKVTVKRLAVRWFGYRVNREKNIAFADAGKGLNYPRQPLRFAPGAPRYNVVFLLADGFRSDMLNPEVTPHLDAFAQQSLNFQNHFSGGNGTRFGVFSLLYGLYGNLWHPFLEARQSPVLIDALRERNYQFTILCSTRLTFPEFRQTAFVRIPEAISDNRPEPEMYRRDQGLAGKFAEFLAHRDPTRPFLGFIFFNSSHPFYQFPAAFTKFTPVAADRINYMGDLSPTIVAGLKNRYQNALYYSDTLFQQVIDDLRRAGVLDNTILIITGDHGEEFRENGYYSHNSAFDDYQIKTAMVMRIPGEPPRAITALTSHLDLVPTILSRLGCVNPPGDYSHGRDILAATPRDYVVCADWDNAAIVTTTERVIIPVGATKMQPPELRTGGDYTLIADRERLKRYRPTMVQVVKDLGAFLK